MPSPFAKYQSEQVQQIAPGFVEAYGRAGAAIGQGIEKGIAAGFQGYEEAKQKHQQEIAIKAKLAPYIRNDDRITATEGMLKSGLLTKADDGTVAISAKWAQYADKEGLKKYVDFYNQTGGDGSKLSGDALIEFANRFEGEQKFIAEKAANAKVKTENELKQAQIAKLRAEAAAKAAETGLVADIMSGFGAGGEAPDSPTAGIDLSRYKFGGDTITAPAATAPTSRAPASPSVTTVSNTVPGVAAPAAAEPATSAPAPAAPAATAAEPAVSPALTAGTKAAAAKDEVAIAADNLGMTKAGLIEAATRNGQTPQEYAANMESMVAARAKGKTAEPEASTAEAAPTPADPAAAAAEQPAEPDAGQAQQEQQTTAAGSPIPEKFDVAAESVAVKERLDKINTERETVRAKYAAERTKNAATLAKQRQQALALGVVAPQKASAITSYLENSVKFQNEAEARELKALDDKEAAVTRDFANYQAAATAAKGARAEARAERKETAEAEAASQKLKQVLSDRRKKQLQEYPTYGVWTHLGARLGKDKETGEDLDPSDFGIAPLTDQQRTAVNEAVEGWNKSTSFLIDLDNTLKTRIKQGGEWRQAFRLTASNMKNYYEAELASVFGVATLRRAIVSGGNFSDADREFVKSAITYLNTAAPDVSPEDLQASLNALSVFVNGLYERTLETNQMGFNPEAAKAQADKLDKFGLKSQSALIRKGVDRAELFYRRFGIKPPGGNEPSVSQGDLKKAFDVLYPKMKAKGLLPDGMKAN